MNSSDYVNDSLENFNENSLLFNASVEDSFRKRPSIEGVVEESSSENEEDAHATSYHSLEKSDNENKPSTPIRNTSYISSDEDDYGSIVKSTTKRRIRRIASDSEDEFADVYSPATNYSFSCHRGANLLDSDEDDENTEVVSHIQTNTINSSSEDEKIKSPDKTKDESFKPQIKDTSSDKSESNIISVSSEDEEDPVINVDTSKSNIEEKLHQVTLDSLVQNMSIIDAADKKIYCSSAEYANQATKVSTLRTDALKCKNMLRTMNLSLLPDNGAKLLQRQELLEKQLKEEEEQLKKMIVNHGTPSNSQKPITWEQLETNSACVVPNTFGKQAMSTYSTQKALTMDRLKDLHDSLATCPSEDTIAENPQGMKVELMLHQKKALVWLVWREGQKPSGGILADDMGLGKTLTMISLILTTKNSDDSKDNSDSDEESVQWIKRNSKYNVRGGTLVVCPASLIRQWEGEIEKRIKRNLLTVELYHGTKRETRTTRLAKYDVVITTYQLVQRESETKGPLFGIKWKRIILDEAHIIRNHKSLTSVGACKLLGRSRWALTGTPVHNKEMDLYALLKFLKCSPFDDLGIWKQWVANKSTGGQDRLNTVITSILLRRTKEQLQNQGSLEELPAKNFELIKVALDKSEQEIYHKILVFSRTLFIEFLRQRAMKNPEFTNIKGGDLTQTNDEEYNRMHRKILQMHGDTAVKSHEILVLLLRLRQICCHPSLVVTMLDNDNCEAEGIEDDGIDIDMLEKLNNLNLDEENANSTQETEGENFSTAANKILNKNNPVFADDRPNEKLRVIQQIIEEKVIPNGDKIIIVSQWTSMLNIILCHLKRANIKCDILDGKVPVHKRNDIVVDFNNPTHKIKVLLLSLTAGGVGLNLAGANHLLLVDLHWNPQLESQAQDRIYRVGQKKPVHIYKIVTTDTIEERIKSLQEAKLSMATNILAGVRSGTGSKLSMDDLKMLFNIK